MALFALSIVTLLIPVFRSWPLCFLVPIGAYFLIVGAVSPLRASFRLWRFGRVSTFTGAATLVITVVSCGALVAFHVFARPDVSVLSMVLPHRALGSVFIAGAVFAVLNALLEEVVFRGVFFDAIESPCGAWFAVVATAVIFGLGHMEGYPRGPLGAVLAGSFGLALGWLRVVTGGLGLSVIAHIAADATIFTLIAGSAVL